MTQVQFRRRRADGAEQGVKGCGDLQVRSLVVDHR